MTELRNQIFRVFKMVDAGEDVTIIKKDSNKKYRIIPVKIDDTLDTERVAKEMASIGIKTLSPNEMKKVFESRYE